MAKKRRTNSIVAVTLAVYATMYVEADTPEEAMEYAKKHKHLFDSDDFDDQEPEVDSCEAYTTEVEDWMDEIWVEDGKTLTMEEYLDELEEQGEEEYRGWDNRLQLNLFNDTEE